MKITDRIHLVGSGALGSGQTDDYDCNVYLLDAGDSAVLIDSGAGIRPELIADAIVSAGYELSRISHLIVTHGHADHSGGAAVLQRLTGAAVVCSPATARILREADEAAVMLPAARQAGIYPRDYRLSACSAALEVKHGDCLRIGDLTLEFIATPGHAADMISCYVRKLSAMFVSDVLFADGTIAMQVAPDFSFHELANSVKTLSGYNVDGLYPGHKHPLPEGGGEVIRQVRTTFEALRIPPNIV